MFSTELFLRSQIYTKKSDLQNLDFCVSLRLREQGNRVYSEVIGSLDDSFDRAYKWLTDRSSTTNGPRTTFSIILSLNSAVKK